jgi:prepilin-type N-terminal cleavage/methylation domain-containing protein
MKSSFSHFQKHARQAGYTLVELSVALAIVGVILVGALVGSRQVLLSNSVNAQVRDSAQVIAKVQRQYAKQTSTTGATTDVLGPLAIWPSDRATVSGTATTVRGVIGGSSEFIFTNDAAIGTLAANQGFIYTLRKVRTDACADLVTALDPLSFAIYAGASPAAAPTNGSTPTTTAVKAADTSSISMSNLATACAPTGNPNEVDISVVFRL